MGTLRQLFLTLPLSAAILAAPGARGQTSAAEFETVYWDAARADGTLVGGRLQLALPGRPPASFRLPAPVTPLTSSPSGPANRIDLVLVGDGYTAAELGSYQSDVNAMVASFFSHEPFTTYANYFDVYRVDVISNESGVDNDPTQGIDRDTALDMGFWCAGIERLLCVNVAKAYGYANNAPDVDQVIALANSSKYGGAGYTSSNLATSSGKNGAASEVVIHELGHSLGNLADEYDYGGSTTYSGPEVGEPNVSILDAAAMAASGTKWAAWLGHADPAFDGLVDTFEGARYHRFGIYRPTTNSLMRSLSRPFNPPSVEALLLEIYRIVSPIDDHADDGVVYDGSETLWVVPMTTGGPPLTVQWSLDGVPIPGATGTTLDLASLGLTPCNGMVGVRVVDPSPWVRDEAARAQWMSASLDFQLDLGPLLWNTCQTSVNSVGVGAVMGWSGGTSLAANDLVLRVDGGPPGQFGLFFYGPQEAHKPLGDGVLCLGGPLFRLPVAALDGGGSAAYALDLSDPPQLAGQITAGSTWYFQFWYRDPGQGSSGFNFSDALGAVFCD